MAKTLVLYYSATQTTARMAQAIADALATDLAPIHPVEPYTAADLDWHDPHSRTSLEQHEHNQRVAVTVDWPDPAAYDNVILGHPIWWAIPPRLISAVIDHLDLNGKHFASFATSGGSGYDRCQVNLKRAIDANGYHLAVLNPGRVLSTPAQAQAWARGLTLAGNN